MKGVVIMALLAAASPAAAQNLYRCVDYQGAGSIQDAPCPPASRDQADCGRCLRRDGYVPRRAGLGAQARAGIARGRQLRAGVESEGIAAGAAKALGAGSQQQGMRRREGVSRANAANPRPEAQV
jgi:hypothetical protein